MKSAAVFLSYLLVCSCAKEAKTESDNDDRASDGGVVEGSAEGITDGRNDAGNGVLMPESTAAEDAAISEAEISNATGSDQNITDVNPPFVASSTVESGNWIGWGISQGLIEIASDDQKGMVVHHSAPGDGQTSYFLTPSSVAERLGPGSALTFELRSDGGTYYDFDGEGFFGDVVVEGAGRRTFLMLEHEHDAEWHRYRVVLSAEDDWSVSGVELEELFSNVTSFAIRAEFGSGLDESWLADFAVEDD